MYGSYRGYPEEPEQEEVIVFDWNNSTNSIPVGTSRLLNVSSNLMSSATRRPPPPAEMANPTGFGRGIVRYGDPSKYLNYAQGSTDYFGPQQPSQNSFGHYPSPYAYTSPLSAYNSSQWTSNPSNSSKNSSTNNLYEQRSSTSYFDAARPVTSPYAPRNNIDDNDWCDIEEIDYSRGFREVSREQRTSKPRPSPAPRIVDSREKSSDFMEFEEIDYSHYNNQDIETTHSNQSREREDNYRVHHNNARQSSSISKEAVEVDNEKTSSKSRDKSRSPSKVPSPDQVPAPVSLDVPKPGLPLSEVLSPVIPKSAKQKESDVLRNSRKRPRNESSGESSSLEDFLYKSNKRVSSRTYAKPTRRVDKQDSSKTSTPESIPASLSETRTSVDFNVSPSISQDAEVGKNETHCDDNQGKLKETTPIHNEHDKSLDEGGDDRVNGDSVDEVKLTIRTDIFETVDDEDE